MDKKARRLDISTLSPTAEFSADFLPDIATVGLLSSLNRSLKNFV
ncbi:MAG: hypothetical protein ACRYGG_20090 [Janthinobacterium lividum]